MSFMDNIFVEKINSNEVTTYSSEYSNKPDYPITQAHGDIGIYNDMPYDGTGIKIGILDDGISCNWR